MAAVGSKPGEAAHTEGTDYADPGYQADKLKRYPLDTREHVDAASRYFAKQSNREKYSAAQQKAIQSKINAAKRKFGVDPGSYRDVVDGAP